MPACALGRASLGRRHPLVTSPISDQPIPYENVWKGVVILDQLIAWHRYAAQQCSKAPLPKIKTGALLDGEALQKLYVSLIRERTTGTCL